MIGVCRFCHEAGEVELYEGHGFRLKFCSREHADKMGEKMERYAIDNIEHWELDEDD